MDWSIAVLIFILSTSMDYLWVYYMTCVESHKAIRAATSGVMIHAIAALAVINYVSDWKYLLFLLAGSWVGTFVSVKHKEKDHGSNN